MYKHLRLSKLTLVRWIPMAFVITVLSGLMYVVLQQNIRADANEPQIQTATDITLGLAVNSGIDELVPKRPVDIYFSTSPFVILYDEAGKPVTSTVASNIETPVPPAGVFNYTRTHSEDRITWQPTPDLRLATIIQHYQSNKTSGFVLVGRNLREVEKNESLTLQLTSLAWFIAMSGSLTIMALLDTTKRRV